MAEIKILKENSLGMAELKKKLEDIKKRNKELGFRATRLEEYLNMFSTMKIKEVGVLKKKLKEADISRLDERHINKIIDIMPNDIDSLKVIFSNEDISLKQEELEKIVKVLK